MKKKTGSDLDANPPQSILIVRLSAFGDIVMASGIIPVLRREFPRARIDWLVQGEYTDILLGTSQLGRVLVWERETWKHLFKRGRLLDLYSRLLEFLRELRSTRYDMVLDLQGLWKSAVPARVCRAKHRIGLDPTEGSSLAHNTIFRSPFSDPGLASEYLHLLVELGLSTRDFALGLGQTEKDQQIALRLLKEKGVDKEYALFCPFTTRPQKHWPMENWAELADKIHERLGLEVVILGGPGDTEAAEELSASCHVPVVTLAGQPGLRQSMALILGARLAVGVDTGLTHVGSMSPVPSVALFGATRPYLKTGRQDSVVLYEDIDCSPCRRRPDCGGKYYCMRALHPERVFQAAAELLAESSDYRPTVAPSRKLATNKEYGAGG